MRWRARSIRHKLLLVVLATTFVALLVSGISLLVYNVREYQESGVADLVTQAELLGRASSSALAFDDPRTAGENLALLQVRPNIVAAAIYTAKGAIFARYTQAGLQSVEFPSLPEAEGSRVEGSEIVVFRRIVEDREIQGTVYLRARYDLTGRLKNYVGILTVVMAASLLVALLLSSWLNNVVTKPVLAVTEVARGVMEERDFTLRATKTTDDEIGYLVDAFNDMLAEVGRRAAALEQSNRTLEHEMSERRGAEQALLAADRRKDEFLAILAHELRNPLAPLRNALEILRLSGGGSDTQRTAREMMERQLKQLVRLVDDLLDVSRITTGKLTLKREPVELHAIIRNALDTARPLMEARQHYLAVSLPPEPVILHADATRLAQVFLNLLNNAAKFTDPGGRIALAASIEHGELVVTVEDNGIGMRPETVAEVFGMFTQADHSLERPHSGLGVGLSLAKRLVELHGGTLFAHSDGMGRGSRFVVHLPLAAGAAREMPGSVAATAAASHAGAVSVLLADDNVDFVDSLAMLLRGLGHRVQVVHDGVAALETARSLHPAFAFVDIGLPKVNGYEVVRRLREEAAFANTVFVAVTGWGQDDDKRRAHEAGFDHHLVKPVEPGQIEALIARPRETQGSAGPRS